MVALCPTILRSMHSLGYFCAIAPDVEAKDLTEEHLKSAMNDLVKSNEDDEPSAVGVTAAIQKVRTNMEIHNPNARIFKVAVDF